MRLLELLDNLNSLGARRYGGFLKLNYRVVVKGYIRLNIVCTRMCRFKHKREE